MPEGRFGFPRLTNIGPFTELEATQEFERDIEEHRPPNLFLDREISIIHSSYPDSKGTEVSAKLIVREQLEEPGDRIIDKIEHEIDVFTRDEVVGVMRYYYANDVARIIDVKVDEDFQRMGIATRLKNLELDHMEENGVEVVYTDVISEGGYRLAKKTGFEPIYRADHIDFQESSLTFSDSSNTGVMFKYL
jgi:ribosomal protein S18 acetylase RimI-like enzyme